MKDELVFKSKISKMGNNRIIWIPLALREMVRDYEDEDIIVTIKKQKTK
jgi:antitoxin component of MazEF toxin-antitoxin module